jgi:hypothetical protein
VILIERVIVRVFAALGFAFGFAFGGSVAEGESPPAALYASPLFLAHAHSHNDYEQKNPCLDAIAARVSSIEADLWFEDGKLLVGHDRGKWRGDFETLYLKPLNEFWERNALPAGPDGAFLLWLDLKDASGGLRSRLHELLQGYAFTREHDARHVRVLVILTGKVEAKEAYVREYFDPLLTRDSNTFTEVDPRGSPEWSWYALNWKTLGDWDGSGEMTDEQRRRLRKLVDEIHQKDRKVRLWNHPATVEFWREACAAGVDRLGTDHLP